MEIFDRRSFCHRAVAPAIQSQHFSGNLMLPYCQRPDYGQQQRQSLIGTEVGAVVVMLGRPLKVFVQLRAHQHHGREYGQGHLSFYSFTKPLQKRSHRGQRLYYSTLTLCPPLKLFLLSLSSSAD